MARKVDILAPQLPAGESVLTVSRWLKMVGDTMVLNEPIVELVGRQFAVYVHAPHDGVLSMIITPPGQNLLSGMILGQVSIVAKDEIEWDNFDKVAGFIEESADGAEDMAVIKDANEALGQLFGITDNPVFLKMNIEQQNKFLQKVVDEQQSGNLNPSAVALKLLEGLQLRMPAKAPVGPRGPSLGPAGPGMGGVAWSGVSPQQQQGYAPLPGGVPNNQQMVYPQAAYPPGVFPGQGPQQNFPPQQQQPPYVPYVPPGDEDK
ncbi:MAG: sucB [Alphaproteobacteria bacterium]|nr:sucB [Alphaproteobacteria bacterium]